MNVAVMMHVVWVLCVITCQDPTNVNALKGLSQILMHILSVLEWLPAQWTMIVQEMQSVMNINAVSAQNPILEMNVDVSEKKLASFILCPLNVNETNENFIIIFRF
jgi:hypothetical protein